MATESRNNQILVPNERRELAYLTKVTIGALFSLFQDQINNSHVYRREPLNESIKTTSMFDILENYHY